MAGGPGLRLSQIAAGSSMCVVPSWMPVPKYLCWALLMVTVNVTVVMCQWMGISAHCYLVWLSRDLQQQTLVQCFVCGTWYASFVPTR